MKRSGLVQKLKSVIGATILTSFLANSSLAESPNKIIPLQDNWQTSFPAEVKTTKMDNYTVIDKKNIPVYFSGQVDNPNSVVKINYSTINQSSNANNFFGISSYQTRVYLVVPEGIDVEILRESISSFDGRNFLDENLKPKSETKYAKKMQSVGNLILGKLREFDPLENNASELGLNEDEEKLGIYETVKSWLVTKPEARTREDIKKILDSKEKPQVLQIDLYPQDRLIPLKETGRTIDLKINEENYSGEKIPISIFERVQIGDSPSTGQGSLEAMVNFEMLNKKEDSTQPNTLAGLYSVIGKDNFALNNGFSLIYITPQEEILLLDKRNGLVAQNEIYMKIEGDKIKIKNFNENDRTDQEMLDIQIDFSISKNKIIMTPPKEMGPTVTFEKVSLEDIMSNITDNLHKKSN